MQRHQGRCKPAFHATVIVLPVKRGLGDASVQQIVSRIPHACLVFVGVSEQVLAAKCVPIPKQRRRNGQYQCQFDGGKNGITAPRRRLRFRQRVGRRGLGIAGLGKGHRFTDYNDAKVFCTLQLIKK
jgi:hypothetical protein